MTSREDLLKGHVNFCNIYGFYRFLSAMSCRKDAPGNRDELFRLLVFGNRPLIHNGRWQNQLRDELFKNDSATLALTVRLKQGATSVRCCKVAA